MATVTAVNIATFSPDAVQKKPRLAWLDFARLIAAYSIVWLHTQRCAELVPWTVLGRFAVPFFTAGAVFFVIEGLRRQPDRTLREYTINRFRRIYLPFLAWSVVYFVMKSVKKMALPDEPNDFSGIEVLWTGTFWHLWFMPFVLIVTLGAFMVGQWVVGRANVEWMVCLTMLSIGMAVAWIGPPAWVAADTNFALLAWNALPVVCWGLALGLVFPRGLDQLATHRITTLLAGCAFTALMAWLAIFGRNTLVENLAGILFLIAALQPKSPCWIYPVARFGSVAFGIYLAHLLLIKTCEAVAAKLHWSISWQLDLLIFAVAAVGSTWLAWALARSRRTRWLVA